MADPMTLEETIALYQALASHGFTENRIQYQSALHWLTTLKAENERRREQVAQLRQHVVQDIEWNGVDHEDPGCPEDDTCTCPSVLALSALLKETEPGEWPHS